MLAERDEKTLRAAGITDPNQVLSAAAAFLRQFPVYPGSIRPNALTADEKALLGAHGAVGLDGVDSRALAANLANISAEFADMALTALNPKAVAALLGVGDSRVRQLTAEGVLYTITGSSGRVYPRFQFTDTGVLPGLKVVLAALSDKAHPVAVQRLFLTPHPDMESPQLGAAVSPRDWLTSGHDPAAVAVLAAEL